MILQEKGKLRVFRFFHAIIRMCRTIHVYLQTPILSRQAGMQTVLMKNNMKTCHTEPPPNTSSWLYLMI